MSTATVLSFTPESNQSTALIEKYRLAYRVSESAMAFAETVKLAGIFLAGVIVVAALIVFQTNPAERVGFPVVSASLAAGAVLVVLAAHLWSMVFRVQGRLLEIAVDSAVNSSPLLSNAERTRAMSLPKEATPGRSEQRAAA